MMTFTQLRRKVMLGVEYGEDIRPTRDWFVLVAGVAVLLILSALWNAWMYVRVESGESIGEVPASAPAVDTNAIDVVQSVFQKRAAEEANYKNVYHFVDPSK